MRKWITYANNFLISDQRIHVYASLFVNYIENNGKMNNDMLSLVDGKFLM